MIYLLFALGFPFLIKGADLLTEGASSIAKKFGLSSLVIGLTIVAFGTSLPEFIVSSLASLSGSNEIAIANIVGSNTANILLVLGIAGLIKTLKVKSSTVFKEIPFALLSMLMLGVFVFDKMLSGLDQNILTRGEGIALLLVFVIFIYYTFGISKAEPSEGEEEVVEMSLGKSALFILIGLAGLTIGGKWIVDGAILIAQNFGLSEALIGVTIIAIGTSLPEIAAASMAAYKGNTSMAVGAAVGSNIFNVLWVLGANAVIFAIPYSEQLNLDMFFAIGATLLLFIFMFIGKKQQLCKWQAAMFLVIYFAYIGILILNT